VIAAEQHATRLVVSSSQRMPAARWASHKDLARKALKKLAGPHVPTSLSKLEQAVKRAHAAYDHHHSGLAALDQGPRQQRPLSLQPAYLGGRVSRWRCRAPPSSTTCRLWN
jgi:hypothetical protein